jgi:GTP pyrophosphokinase
VARELARPGRLLLAGKVGKRLLGAGYHSLALRALLPTPSVRAAGWALAENGQKKSYSVEELWSVLRPACGHIDAPESLERIYKALRLCAELPAERSIPGVRVAAFLARLGVDVETICATMVDAAPRKLLQYPPLDGAVPSIVEDLDALRSMERAAIVDIGDLDEQNAGRLRECILMALRDARAVVIRLAQVLHDLQSKVESGSPAYDQQALALLALQVHIPLAHALGLGAVMWPLEDLSFRILFPLSYRACESWHVHIWEQAEQLLAEARSSLLRSLESDPELGRYRYQITGRTKNLFSTFKKMLQSGKRREEILDIVALRIVIDGIPDDEDENQVCLRVYQHVVAHWPEIPGRFKNYCTKPKANGYRSIHTTLRHPHGLPLEVQIRSQEMHDDAEFGLAAHKLYKGLIKASASSIREFSDFAETIRLENTHVITDAYSFPFDGLTTPKETVQIGTAS